MFRANMCPSSGEKTVFMRLLVRVSVWMTVWYAEWNDIPPGISHPNTVVSPDDGHIVARNM
jgi:hypothetical protein